MIPSIGAAVDWLAPAFSQPSFATACQLFLGWVMCLGKHTLFRVAHSANPPPALDQSQRHGLDVFYNFFERSAWTPKGLAYHVCVLVLTRLIPFGRITLLVDDTLAHKRVAVMALPLLARLHLPGQGQLSCPDLAMEMLSVVLGWFANRDFTLVGDGAYACKELLLGLDERVTFVGRMRGDACVYDPRVPRAKKGQRGRKPTKGPRLPKPREAAAKADRKRTAKGAWVWQAVVVFVYGKTRSLLAVDYEAVWPRVLGLRPIKVVVVRDPQGRMRDCYLFTTDLQASVNWVIVQFAWRWAIEVLFRASKQVLQIESPRHWCQESVEKVAPWVWCMQSVIMVWYLTAGHDTAEAKEMRRTMGEWDSEWSLRHMIQVLQRAILNATINPDSADPAQLRDMVNSLKNWANLAA